ncbi:MAG: Zn-dependent exopeptidase M28, partial [Anaerolineae bacterium]|nr:Zn-dependent exopeptidase M28 [Anaerolineae bacterium]
RIPVSDGVENQAEGAQLLLLAEALNGFHGQHTLEIVAINGEDYYSAPGEMEYLRRNQDAFDTITLAINLDGLGYIKGKTAYSLYGCPDDLAAAARAGLSGYAGLVEGEPWYQGDHMMMVMNQRPALALTSDQVMELLTTIIHTEQDVPAMVDPARLVEAAAALRAVIAQVDRLKR